MLILSIRTDKPQAEIGLFEDSRQLAHETWPAHRQLAETIHLKIEQMLSSRQKTWQDIKGIVCFKGPGSFTGLRIGLTVGNALADGLGVPVVAGPDEAWLTDGIKRLQAGGNDAVALPEYGSPVHVTTPKK